MGKIVEVWKTPLKIDNDVWIGARAIILPGCKNIEKGVIIGGRFSGDKRYT